MGPSRGTGGSKRQYRAYRSGIRRDSRSGRAKGRAHDTGFASAGGLHFDQFALAGTSHLFNNGACVFVIHIDGDFFNRLMRTPSLR